MKTVVYSSVFICVLFWATQGLCQTPISGIVNQYTPITAIDQDCQSRISVGDTTGFQKGQPLLIIQMQGAIISDDDNSSFGEITDLRSAGLYERAIIDSVALGELYLQSLLINDYNMDGSVQAITIPVYQEAEVTAELTAKAWDGSTGGVLIIEVVGRLSMNANISVNGMGFRGGEAFTNLPNDCQWFIQNNDYYYDLNNWRGSAKGEGVAKFTVGREAGRGAQANGGGGGNDHNSGGGGGGNLAAGGRGGENDEPSTFGCKGRNPGQGGRALPVTNGDRVFMGGGGGAGHGNNKLSTNGGNGGGIVIITAGVLEADLDFISARGLEANDAEGDGGGGGGAGGTTVLQIGSLEGFVNFSSDGGEGATATSSQDRCFGPGGGGGGGVVYTDQNFSVANYSNSTFGGDSGISVSPTCGSVSNGAAAGNGTSFPPFLFNGIPQGNQSPSDFSIASQPQDQRICIVDGLSFDVQANGNNLSYQWQLDSGSGYQNLSNNATYSGTQSMLLNINSTDNSFATHTYRCLINSDCASDVPSSMVRILLVTEPQLLSPPRGLTICEGQDTILQLIAEGVGLNFQWQRNDGGGFVNLMDNANFSGTQTDILRLNAANTEASFQCILTDSCGIMLTAGPALLQIEPLPTANFDYTNNGSTFNFNNLSTNGNTFMWDFGDSNGSMMRDPSHTYTQEGTYTVQLEVTNGCGTVTFMETITVIIQVAPVASFTATNGSGCAPLTVSFNDESGTNVSSRLWTFAGGDPATSTDANPTVSYSDAGIFDVRLEVSNSAGSNTLLQENYIRVELQPKADFSYTQNEFTVSFTHLSTDATNFQWNFRDGSPISTEENPEHTFPGNGVYDVTLFATNSLCGAVVTIPVVISIVGTEELSKAPFRLYPNPFHSAFTIDLAPQEIAELQIYNVLGQRVPFERNGQEVRLRKEESGLLYVVIMNKEGKKGILKVLSH